MPDAPHSDDDALAKAEAARRVIVVLGPTAGGKSDLAMELSRRFGGGSPHCRGWEAPPLPPPARTERASVARL